MTGSEVGRLVRTPSSVVVPGTATPPPPSQVAGRSRGRGFRLGLRVLVVGGLAGAAWLFSGAAASAAGNPASAAPSAGLSVVSLVNGLGNEADGRDITDAAANGTVPHGVQRPTGTAVGGPKVATAALHGSAAKGSGPHSDRPARQPAGAAVLTDSITEPVPASPAPAVTDEILAATDGVEGLVKVLAAPFRLTDGPARIQGLLAPLPTTEPIVQGLRPFTDLLRAAADPAIAQPHADLSAVSFAPAAPSRLPVNQALSADGVPALPLASAAFVRDGQRAAGGASLLALQRFAAAHLPDALSATTGVEDAPRSPDPAPLRGHIGAVSGAPSSSSGASWEGGSSATVPSSVVGSAVAGLRLPAAASVEVRRHDAEAPTVSPD